MTKEEIKTLCEEVLDDFGDMFAEIFYKKIIDALPEHQAVFNAHMKKRTGITHKPTPKRVLK